jgi:hypothetical protein
MMTNHRVADLKDWIGAELRRLEEHFERVPKP